MWLIVGLGNPGAEYEGTRHNVGFEVLKVLAARHGFASGKRSLRSVIADGVIRGARALLVRPMTYMNLSGEAVAAIARYYRVEPGRIIVVLDDVALPIGQLRLRFQGSAGGHNGLASVLQSMGTDAISRVRVGVGAARAGRLVGHVLSRFAADEAGVMAEAYQRAADAVETALAEGFETAMNRFNVRPETAPAAPGEPPT
jgi:PTH1 family peptidyl-tRNA hydrolase